MEYQVVIYETVSHKLTVEANSPEEATELAYDLLSNQEDEYLKENYDYHLEAEYAGESDIYELYVERK
jgi:hypothetical protein